MRHRSAIRMVAVASVAAVALLAATETPCQVVPSWATTLDDGGRFETGNFVAIDPAGAIIVGGSSLSTSSSFLAVRLAKLDPSGTLIWSNFYDFPGALEVDGMTVDGAGDILVVCRDNARTTTMKVSGAGAEQWRAFYDTPGFDLPAGIVADGQGRSYIGGTSQVREGGAQITQVDAFIVSYDANGTLLWQDQLDSKNYEERIHAIARDPVSGAIYAAGESIIQFGGLGRQAPWLLRYEPDGRRSWSKRYKQQGTIGVAEKVAVGSDGDVVIAGPLNGDNIQVIKVDARSGKDLWSAVYGGGSHNTLIDIGIDGSGNVFVSGTIESQPEAHPVFLHGVLLRYAADGALSWSVIDNLVGAAAGALAIGASGSVYVAPSPWRTTAYDATGVQLWTSAYPSGPCFSPGPPGIDLAFTRAGDLIVAGGACDILVLSYAP